LENLDVIENRLKQLEQQLDLVQYEQANKISQVSFTDLDGSSTTSDIASAINDIRDSLNSLYTELQRINFMQSKG
jgi:phage shock protein A